MRGSTHRVNAPVDTRPAIIMPHCVASVVDSDAEAFYNYYTNVY